MCGSAGCGEALVRLLAIGLSSGSVIALNAIGVTLVYGVVRTINFAYGDLFALTTVLAIVAAQQLRLAPETPLPLLLGGLLLMLLIAAGSSACGNLLVERLAFKPFRGRSRIAPLIAGVGLSFVLYQAGLFVRTLTNAVIPGEHRSVPGLPEFPRLRIPELLPRYDLVNLFAPTRGITYPLKDLLIVLLAGALALLVGAYLRGTRTGRALRACAQDPIMAQLCGVNRDRTILAAFALGGALSGAAAWAHAVYFTGPVIAYGAQSGLMAFAAAVLGGIGRPAGAFAAGLLLGVVAALSDYFLAAQWTQIILLAILILLLLLRPQGLAGGEDGDPGTTSLVDASGVSFSPRASASWPRYGLVLLALIYPLIDRALGLNLTLVLIGMFVLALLALGLNLMLGLAGLLDLGYAACFAVGAYTAGLLSPGGHLYYRLPFVLPDEFLLLATLCLLATSLFGALNAALTMRLRGEYLAIVTLAFGQIVPRLMRNLDWLTGGVAGLSAIPPPRLLGLTLASPAARYYLALACLLLFALASLRLIDSRLGRAWRAMSADEIAAASAGVNLQRMRLAAFVVGSAAAGVAGALFARSFSYVDPNQSEFWLSAMLLAMVVLGGAGRVCGVILAALFVASYDTLLIPLGGALLSGLAARPGWEWAAAFDPRSFNYLAFGLTLYLAVLWRGRV
jgi:branched-chain amino acid transport system permease protein